MKDKNLTKEQIQDSEIEAKRISLETKLSRPVHAFKFVTGKDDNVIGFIKEPERITKLAVIDMFYEGKNTGAGAAILETCLIKEESDPRIMSETVENDGIYIGAVMKCQEIVRFYTDQLKKK